MDSVSRQLLMAGRGAGDANYADVSLLMPMDGSNGSTTFIDSSPVANTFTGYNGAQISTAQSKFGGSSALFDGSNDYIEGPTKAGYQFGTGDFTVEFWMRFITLPTVAGAAVMIGTYASSTTGWLVQRSESSGGLLRFGVKGDTIGLSAAWTTAAINTWYHVAITRSGTSLRAFINGTQIGSTATNSTDMNDATAMTLGCVNISGSRVQYFNGYLEDIRVTKGLARYTSNFTAPTAAFPLY